MKKILLLALACLTLISFNIISKATTTVVTPNVTSLDLSDWPYCNEPTPTIPFFDPCPEGSHIDRMCAAICGIDYQNSMDAVHKQACIDFLTLYLNLLKDLNQAEADRDACIAAGNNPVTCETICKQKSHSLDNQFGVDKEKLAKRVAEDSERILNDYYNCLLACPCLEN